MFRRSFLRDARFFYGTSVLAFIAAALACSTPRDSAGISSSPAGAATPPSSPPTSTSPTSANASQKPNVVVLMLDDVGFGHLSSFGGPVRTPNIERVASAGLRYTNFHTTALCSPSRAAFLTGRNHHSVGTGKITELASDDPGYTGRIPKSAATFVEVLRENGYRTFGLGKWHNTPIEDVTPKGPYDLWPSGMGFDHFYGFLGADIDNWAPVLWNDRAPITPSLGKPDYHLTTDLADRAVAFVDEHARDASPFVLYIAPGTAHAPHHAPKAFIDANKGRFDQGWDKVREETFARQQAMGIMSKEAPLAGRPSVIPAWASLSRDEEKLYARMQEVFAGALEHADHEFGRVLDELDRTGKLDNTIVIVTSDNGASGEGGLEGSYNEMRVFNGLPESLALNLKYIDKLGGPETFNHYPAGWALAGNTPGRYWKQTTHEGGVRDPFIISWPKGIAAKGEVRSQFTHMIDLAPTILELARTALPDSVNGEKQMPFEGASFVPTLASAAAPTQRVSQYFEMFGNRGLWAGGWKAVTFHGRMPWDTTSTNPHFDKDIWELYDVDADPNETKDLAKDNPGKLTSMKELFDEEAKAHNVFPLSDSTSGLIALNYARLVGNKTEFTYEGVTVRTPEPLSPPIKTHSHTITATVHSSKEGTDGVLVTCGGRFGGYSLYVKDGRLTYAYNYVGESTYTLVSSDAVPAGDAKLQLVYKSIGPNKGHARLYINDRLVGERDIPRTVSGIFSAGETFDTGTDTGTAAGNYDAPFSYAGTLGEVKITLDDVASDTGAVKSEHENEDPEPDR